MNIDAIVEIVLIVPAILFALCFHEFAHAWTAYKLGDNTAKDEGRLTLNPLAHLDFLGTVMMFLVHFGWAKPVPVNPRNFRNPSSGMALTAVAGPLSNIISAIGFGLLLRLLIMMPVAVPEALYRIVVYSVMINLSLAIFNMIPIPPLDGSKILMHFSKMPVDRQVQFEQIGPAILFALIILGRVTQLNVFGHIVNPFVSFFGRLLTGLPLM